MFPERDWIVTANQAVTYPEYPYFLTDDWSYGARSQRIVDRVVAATADGNRMTAQEMADIQFDAWNENAAFLVPKIKALNVEGVDGVDWSRPYVLVANHQSVIDICALFRAVPVPLRMPFVPPTSSVPPLRL